MADPYALTLSQGWQKRAISRGDERAQQSDMRAAGSQSASLEDILQEE
jgi:hypothetical protein